MEKEDKMVDQEVQKKAILNKFMLNYVKLEKMENRVETRSDVLVESKKLPNKKSKRFFKCPHHSSDAI